MVFQAYIDDSADRNVQVLAGYIAPFEAWMAFTEEWNTQLKNFGMQSFKMRRMAQTKEGLERAEIFYRIIERYVTVAISCTVDKHDLVKVIREVPRPAKIVDIDKLENAYYPAFNGIFTCLPYYQEHMGINEPIDFIFDDQSEKANLVKAWDLLKAKADPSVRRFMGASPRFEKDEDFLPLQAADLYAWWVRRWEAEGLYDVPNNNPQFSWERRKKMVCAEIRYREDELREELEEILSERSLFLMRQPTDVLRQIDEGRLYEQEISQEPVRTSLRARLRRFFGRFR
jgi:hypothetical protein